MRPRVVAAHQRDCLWSQSRSLIQVKGNYRPLGHMVPMLAHHDSFRRFSDRFLGDHPLSDASALQFDAAGRVIEVEPDTPVRLDDSCDQLVFLAQGATKLVALASGGREQVVGFHFAGDMVCVPARAVHAYHLFALEQSVFLAFSYEKVIELADDNTMILKDILGATRTALARCREKSIALGRKTAPERIASFLVGMAERIGEPDGNSTAVRLPMSRRDIADSLGVTIETVSRQLTLLRQRGVIETSGRSMVRILDLPSLIDGAGFYRPSG